MKRYIVLLLMVAIVLGALCGCQEGNAYNDMLSDKLREEILQLYEHYPESHFINDDEDTVAGMQYYGTYNGYAVLFDAGVMEVVTELEIDGRVFKWGSGGISLLAYKNGQMLGVKELYESGDMTGDDLDAILIKHKEYFSKIHSWEYDSD